MTALVAVSVAPDVVAVLVLVVVDRCPFGVGEQGFQQVLV
jgi:hypothetical protein